MYTEISNTFSDYISWQQILINSSKHLNDEKVWTLIADNELTLFINQHIGEFAPYTFLKRSYFFGNFEKYAIKHRAGFYQVESHAIRNLLAQNPWLTSQNSISRHFTLIVERDVDLQAVLPKENVKNEILCMPHSVNHVGGKYIKLSKNMLWFLESEIRAVIDSKTAKKKESPQKRAKRLYNRAICLKAKGNKRHLRTTAEEEGISVSRLKQIFATHKDMLNKN